MPEATRRINDAGSPAAVSRDRGPRRDLIVLEVPVERIDPDPDQPRKGFDSEALERLARSLTTHGLIQPIAVRLGEQRGRFVVVSGERRWRAAVAAGLPTVAAVVLDVPATGTRLRELQIVENALREGLSPLDQARAFRDLSDLNGWGSRQVARALHVHATTVSRSLALLRLPQALLALVESGRLTPRVALEVSRVRDPSARDALAARAESECLTVADVRRLTRPGAAVPVVRRVFTTTTGVVMIETGAAGDYVAVQTAVVEVARVLAAEAEARIRGREGARPEARA